MEVKVYKHLLHEIVPSQTFAGFRHCLQKFLLLHSFNNSTINIKQSNFHTVVNKNITFEKIYNLNLKVDSHWKINTNDLRFAKIAV